jgi:hypothetical protein
MAKIEAFAIQDGVILYRTPITIDLSDKYDVRTYLGATVPGWEIPINEVLMRMMGISQMADRIGVSQGVVGLDILELRGIYPISNLDAVLGYMRAQRILNMEDGRLVFDPNFDQHLIRGKRDVLASLPYERVRVFYPSESSLELLGVQPYRTL